MKKVDAFIGIGSNFGNREENIKKALEFLKATKGISIKKKSKIIETEAQGGPPQSKFLNGVIKIETTLLPKDLLKKLQEIEDKLGRVRSVENAPRTIDLDILLYGSETIDEPDLKIPHPRMYERDFVVKPLLELDSGM